MCIAFAPVLECFLVCPGELTDDQVIHFTGYDVKNILTYHGIPLDQHVFYSGTLPEYKMLFRKIIRELQQCKYGYEDYIASMFNTILLLVSRQQQEGENVEINIPEEIEAAVAYLTPKVETRAAIFNDGKILLVHEKDGTWAMPGGWCDVDQGVGSNSVKETKEETGRDVVPERLIAVQDWRKHNIPDLPCALIRNFVLCKVVGGSFEKNVETSETRYFSKDELPENLAPHKCTVEQINMCFDANEAGDSWKTLFD